MDSSKKLVFSEPFMSQRRKVISGFSLGVGVSLVFFTLLLLNNTSLTAPKVQAFLQGSDSNSSFSWHFPFTTRSLNGSVSLLHRAEVNVSGERLGKTLVGNQKNESLHFGAEEEHSSSVKDVSFLGEGHAHVGNSSCSGGGGDGKCGEGLVKESGNFSVGSFRGECDIFDGKWVRDESKPYYPLGSCPHIDRDFDCHLNGRPDSEYVKWKWQPNGCDIPSLNATDFLEKLRGQKLVFVGDSLNRNMWESLVCILRQSVKDKKRVFEISGKTEFKKKDVYAFRFEDYNCSVDFVSSPFIVQESTFKGINGSFETLRLDLMDQTATTYHDADIIVFNTGHWWTHEKTSRGEYYYQEGNHVYPRLKVLDAYTRALATWAKWIDNNIDVNRTQVFFRGYSVTHFRGGQWNSGGQCHKETEPISNGQHLRKYPSKMRAFEHVIPRVKTQVIYLNISRLTDYRKDAHPSIYRMEYKTAEERTSAELHQDCSHWCLPGVPDTWNELLYASLLKYGKGHWKS
ncbi:protein trichome birefringence-like 2 [Cajanus cajan]|uniref:protein trichome birefringence-like 2 n=1 Tax=Cajanus cajan TaxID=3821 RepID=UPI00098D925D|nr:protein trichome birefringence-like 2 [Cajanus cajan]